MGMRTTRRPSLLSGARLSWLLLLLVPVALFAQPEKIAQEARAILDAFGPGSGHVFNLGHGISQFTPPEHVAALVNAVHEHSRKQRQI